jgi:hypothetical protein
MTAELRHRDNLRPQMIDNQRTYCHACPHYSEGVSCDEACTVQAQDAGLAQPQKYYLFDPLLYTTWRLTR